MGRETTHNSNKAQHNDNKTKQNKTETPWDGQIQLSRVWLNVLPGDDSNSITG